MPFPIVHRHNFEGPRNNKQKHSKPTSKKEKIIKIHQEMPQNDQVTQEAKFN